ncbi:zinc finger protein 710 isoform X1 [Scleropages formosus]|uniref:zinc finger protein 710 isoform X1 n=1 Tax=Scleropages formosus TaxID=113540 RepID=UPI0008783BC3|nr:zinc finger protein 710 isoform X1 [Scleropages formosus]
MRSLKHLKHHARNNVEDESGLPVRCTSDQMDQHVEAATQTEPVVVLSLAQAAVLGLISQNEVFGATIAPNGFYMGEAKESSPPEDDMEYEYTNQLIGANGDYLDESPANELPCNKRRQLGPFNKGRRSAGEAEPAAEAEKQVKGEGVSSTLPPCFHMVNGLIPRDGLQLVGATPYRVPLKEEQSKTCCPNCENGAESQQTDTQPEQAPYEEGESERRKLHGGEEEDRERHNSDLGDHPPSTRGEGKSHKISSCSESSEVCYESSEMGTTGDYDDNSQPIMWPEHMESEGQQGRRMQMDRLDINVQIDESYCVDVGEGLKRWKCRMCEKSYTSKYNLVTHILGHNGIKPHECLHCGKLFKQPSHLQTHLLTHQGTRPHKCTVCKKAFTQTSHLKRHMLQHTDVKPYSCRFCGRGFAYPSELRAHETKHESGRCHVCTQCGMEFPSYAHLRRHQASHQGPTSYQCSECNKSFAYRSQLQNHLMKHQNVRPFVCSECGMEFVQIHHLKQHALTHKVMKGFRCDVCSREFTLSANLKRHKLIHASIRPYQCHICFKTFVQKQTLKTHMIVHLPVKPFKCKVCGKSFNRMYNLLGHMHLHAGSKPFKCPYCSSKFNLKGNLSRHMKVKHGVMDISPESQDTPLQCRWTGLRGQL